MNITGTSTGANIESLGQPEFERDVPCRLRRRGRNLEHSGCAGERRERKQHADLQIHWVGTAGLVLAYDGNDWAPASLTRLDADTLTSVGLSRSPARLSPVQEP